MISKSAIDNELANRGAAAAIAASTPAVDTTPTPNYDSTPQANADNPWGDTATTSSEETPKPKQDEGQDAMVNASQESDKPEQPRNANAQQALADTQTQAADPVATMRDAGVSDARINELQQIANYASSLSPEQFQAGLSRITAQDPALAALYAQYYGAAATQVPAAPAQTPTPTPIPTTPTTPTVQNDEGSAALQNSSNTVDPNGIYDPSNPYGRTADGKYTYSYSAQQLQNELARRGYYKGAIDGLFGEQTQQALNNYLSENGVSATPQAAAQGETPAPNGNSQATTTPATNPQDNQPTNNTLWEQVRTGWNRLLNGESNTVQNAPTSTQEPSADTPQAPTHEPTIYHSDNEPNSFGWFVEQYKQNNAPNGRSAMDYDADARTYASQQILELMEQNNPTPSQKAGNTAQQVSDAVSEAAAPVTADGKPIQDIVSEGINQMREDNVSSRQGDQQYGLWQLLHPGQTIEDYYRIYPDRAPQPESTPARDSATDADMARAEQREQRRLQAEEASELEREALRRNILNGNVTTDTSVPVMQVSGASNNNPTLGEALSAQTFSNGFNFPQQLVTPPQENTEASQSPFPTPTSNGYVSTADFNANDYRTQLEEMENEEPTSTIPDVLPTPKAGASMAGNSYSRALADNQARPDTNIFRQDAPDVDEFRRAYEESMNRQSSSPDVRYGQQFMNDIRQLRQQFPTYSDTALFDMALFNEEMRNGQSSYYKWIANQLG